MIGSTAFAAAAAALCLATGLTCLVLAAAGTGDRAGRLTHAVMGLAMAGMFSPWGDPVPRWAGAVAFAVLGSWFAAAALRRDRARAAAPHLAISSGAMAVMYLTSHHAPAAAAAGAHAGHGAGGGATAGLLALPLALVLAGYFAWHAWTCVDRSRARVPAAPAPAVSRPGRWAAGRLEPAAHGVMSALMAAMFLTAI